jgi:CheY-like chemotaxis protein
VAKRILIVDDDEGFLLAARRILEAAGYHVQTATSTTDARKCLAGRVPDVILLDVVVPPTDGFQFSEQLAKDKRVRGVPVILCTVVAENPGQMMRAFEEEQGLAATTILPKGEVHERLLEVVASALESAGRVPVRGAQA